jgi:hypothetical protein
MMSLVGVPFADESEWKPLNSMYLHFSGKYEEYGTTYHNILSINANKLKLITFKKNKPFGVLFPNEQNDCVSNCEFKIHFGDKDVSLHSESVPMILWWSSERCIWSKHDKGQIYEKTNGFRVHLRKYEIYYNIQKLRCTKNRYSSSNYMNTNFYENYYDAEFFKKNYLRYNFTDSRSIYVLKLTTK